MATVHFDEAKKHTATTDFDYAALDHVEGDEQPPNSDRDVLRAALSLLLIPAPVRIVAARVAMIYSLLFPATRTVDLLRLYHGVRRQDLTEARIELASLLRGPPDEKKNAPVGAEAILAEVGNHVRDGDSDAA